MTKLVICLLFFGLFAIQTVGHMNSDPAPGRSPGPPPAKRSLAATAALPPVVHNASATNDATTNTVTASAPASATPAATATQTNGHNDPNNQAGNGHYGAHSVDRNYGNNGNNNKDGSAVKRSNSSNGNTNTNTNNNNNNNEQQLVSRNTELTNTDEININLSKLPSSSDGSAPAAALASVSDSGLGRTDEHYTYDNLAHMASARVANSGELSRSTATGAAAAAEALIAQQTKANTISNTRSCHDGFSDFLNDVVDVEEEEQSETNGEDVFDERARVGGGHMGHHLFIDLRLEHHVFETSAVGINCGLMYQVRLLTYAKPSTPKAAGRATRADAAQTQPLGGSAFVEATTAENTSTKAKVNSQEDMRDRSNTANAGNDNDSGPGGGDGSGSGSGNGNGNELHYTGEFFVETLSTLSGRERGSFVDHHSAAASNKLPISWFSSLQRNGANLNGDDADAGDDDSRDFEAEKNDFDSATSASDEENFAFGHNYDAIGSGHGHFQQQQQQQQQQQMFATKWLQQSWDKTTNRRSQNNSSRNARKMCPENKWHGSAKSQQQQQQRGQRDSSGTGSNEYQAHGVPGAGSGSGANVRDEHNANGNEVHTESLGFWMLNELCEQDDTIEFRVFFRATFESDSAGDTRSRNSNNNSNMNNANGSSSSSNTNNNNNNNGNNIKVDAQHVVFKKTFKFQLRKDCQLLLREVTRGNLDYTALPLYSIDCTVHFPPYRLFETEHNQNNPTGSASAANGDIPPAGILVELQRLNVPCNSGGYIRFNERTRLCGKLEELNAADRSYHFDVRSHTTVHFHKSPMFSLSYKLVDYCYNITTSNQTGEYYIRPSMRDAVECYFRIHLPYGNRISLTLVTNNDSALLQPNDGIQLNAAGEQDMFNIYTTEGIQIDTKRINLTLLSSGSGSSKKSGAATSTMFRRAEPKASARTQAQEQSSYTLRAYNATREHVNKRSTSSLDGFLRIMESKIKEFSFAASGKSLQGTSDISNCDGVIVKIFESDSARWSYCINDTNRMQAFLLTSTGNTLNIHLFKATRINYNNNMFMSDPMPNIGQNTPITSLPTVYLSYVAQPIVELVSSCDFGWVAIQQFCINAIEVAMSWPDAEEHCVNLGGHLASIRNEQQQQVIHEILFRSPGYDDQNAYWVGGSDSSYEGDFRWSDGLLFQYTNWFPGWTEHSHYNKQPNDDGLSSQDCIELRRFFRTPPGIQANRSPLTSTFMWNDRDCSAKNFLICERPMSDDSLRRSWINDCNKTVSLTKEHPRASIWSPSFPRQYPDNANCFTTITAPTGYRVVIEFEELVIENEAGCTYDYLEITEPTHYDNFRTTKSSKNKNMLNINNSSKSNININKTFRKRSSYEKPSLSSSYTMPMSTSTSTYTSSNSNANAYSNTYTNYASTNAVNNINTNVNPNANANANFNTNTNNNNNYLYSNSYNNYNLAQTNYQKLLHIFSSLYRPHTNYLIQTPDYPHGNPNYPTNHHNRLRSDANAETNALPKRLCGDWSSKLKLLRHVSTGSYLGLHFVSDYSHHFGGFKAKTYMENTASECANERLKYYNGSCYLFISYPEVDWWTAQQVCRGMGAQLSSVSSSDEHRFITSNIRNQIDYSPQLIYWLGAELEKSGQFEWTDDTRMSFQGWLPGQGQFEELPTDAICLGLQWKMSPTPMLPSGLYWQSQKCSKIGGYVCKKPKDSFGTFSANNLTITGAEGRLVSPAYPSTYPTNLDYWVHIKTPERTRIILQFQKIDLEPQDECLYDYVSIQDYELVSHITLEPGSNPLPMAMLTSEEELTSTDNEVSIGDFETKYSQRPKRSIRRKKRWSYQTTTNTASNEYTKRAHTKKYESSKRTHNGSPHFSSELLTRAIQTSNSWLNTASGSVTKYQNPKHRRRKAKVARRKRNSILEDSEPLMIPLPVDNAQSFLPYVRWCGTHTSNMSKFDFVSSSNEAMLNFHSDYSVNGIGFAATWKAIDVSGCPLQTLTSREGTVFSPNYPHFLLNNLNCAYVIQAPAGRRVWLEFNEFDLKVDAILEVDIGSGLLRPFHTRELLSEGIFVSEREQLRIQFRTGQHPRGKGFQAVYRTVAPLERRERIISLQLNSSGYLYQLNYPHPMPENVDFTHHLVAPFGQNIMLELHGVEFSDNGGCPDGSLLEVFDNYADNNGTNWQLCKYLPPTTLPHTGPPKHPAERPNAAYDYLPPQDIFYSRSHSMLPPTKTSSRLQFRTVATAAPPVYITSYLNTLHIRQRTGQHSNALLNGTVSIQWDNTYKMKLTAGEKTVESCQPNPCQFNGKCVNNNGSNYCQCQGHYTGRFCGLNICELEPCVFGKCELTTNSFKCQCQPGYMGHTCELKQRPCAENPCEGRGACFERNGGYFCRCHAWWEGARCERRMLHIPYKPLSERMLQEPFWLGLITVFVVLAVIGLVWCAKRHFPEKIEKLLAEEADRNRPPGSIHGHHHHTSLREQLQFTTAIPQSTGNIAPGTQRSIFNRLGIRKPSLLSLSSPNPIPGGGGAAARTFSLDDLLRPPPRRSPSPRKKRNNSTPVKKNAAEKKQILQQLVSPATNVDKPKVSLGELINMTENRLRASANNVDSESDVKETTFSENSGSLTSTNVANVARTIADPKLEKKVTFARLLNKVSAEMSSGSDMDIGHMTNTRNSSALSLPTDLQFRASSVPPSPCTNDIRSPHSTSSNQGSDSLSSSDLALTDFGLRSMQTSGSEIGGTNHNTHLPLGIAASLGGPTRSRIGTIARPKVSSADSILAMFRNLASSSSNANANAITTASNTTTNTANITHSASVYVSPSTTPTASSPQDDAPGDDESSTSSMHTPVSFSSGPPDSPVFYRQTTIEVPVLDVLNAHKSSSTPSSSNSSSSTNLLHPPTILLEIPSNGINNKCLSPIREMPTPMPSPALTPIMPRPQRSNSPIFQEDPLSTCDYSDDEQKSIRSDCSDEQMSEKIVLDLHTGKTHVIIDSDVETTPTDTATTSMAGQNRGADLLNKLPLLRFSPPTPTASGLQATNTVPKAGVVALKPPAIVIDVEPPTPEEKTPRPRDLIIPTLTVEHPSPTRNRHPMIIFPGSPPPQRASIGETSFMFPNKQQQKRLLKQFEKPNSLEFPFVPPMITVTSNMSELESDAEPMSPATKTGNPGGLMPPNPVGMCYLSPFTMCSRADRTISESNLSSSGYSSMASPGPSRCGSSNPLCPGEMDEPGSGHSGGGLSLHVNLLNRRKNSALASCKENITNGKGAGAESGATGSSTDHLNRPRSDSETFSDEIILESNDEGIGTDHVDEKMDDCRLSSNRFKTLGAYMAEHVLIEVDEPQQAANTSTMSSTSASNQMAQLQLPSIVIQIDGNEKGLSPVSSRSESPLSERASMGRFSPHFYGRKDQLPFTDSDGLYDFPSSDGKGGSFTHQRRSSSKKRERKSSKCSATQSPTKQQLDIPSKESLTATTTPSSSTHTCSKHCLSHHHPCPASAVTTRKSPKRRLNSRPPVASSSSSSESLVSPKELALSRPLPRRLNSPNREKRPRKQESLSEEEVADALLRRISPSIVKEDTETVKPKCKINRLRAIGNQIRFLRRLKKSIKTRERLASPSDSCPEENTDDMDSPQATSPLLQPASPSKTRIALCRQKRLPSGTYGITAAALNSSNWKGMDRSLIGDDLNSD
ncbi:uncharacterized protein LOC105229811 isoform X4 [Bactrocera dorsalis]|uniref:Uncharacterized protein LOC105229811 isoform X4 n=1 Tax=Bactrocera dorsalis TaxID=27457 RepID=A0ABM3JLR9_BACDO|nr:uncharacterized protein LOC105229811 isoform X4 [Bactrocera dorsalis]